MHNLLHQFLPSSYQHSGRNIISKLNFSLLQNETWLIRVTWEWQQQILQFIAKIFTIPTVAFWVCFVN